MRLRSVVAVGVLIAWAAGLAALAHAERTRSPRQKLAEVALRVAPGASFFAVEHAGVHVGFASSTIDTVPGGLQVTDYFVADVAERDTMRRIGAQSVVRFTRTLALRDFRLSFDTGERRQAVHGWTVGDSLLAFVVERPGRPADTTRISLGGPLLMPTLVPTVVALGDPPATGGRTTVSVFDPFTLTTRDLHVNVRAESTFVLLDSAAFDPDGGRWRGAHFERVKGWHIVAEDPSALDSWVDEAGRVIRVQTPSGFTLRRTAYELGFENWRSASARARSTAQRAAARTPANAPDPGDSNVVRLPQPLRDTVRLRVRGLDLSRLQLRGGYQSLSGDTLTAVREGAAALRPSFPLPPSEVTRRRFPHELRAESSIEVGHPAISALALRLKARDAQADVVARRIMQWVHDSLAQRSSDKLPSAAATLLAREGDANARAQLFAALTRAAGIPTRLVSGTFLDGGRLVYHAWAEVLLQRWVPVDPTLGQFPADAAHIRLLVGSVGMETEVTRLIARATVDILPPTRTVAPSASPASGTAPR
ncbi:MAG: transglutaminase-like domain-containing protein [Gemmatimonadaceae bacterium]